jgi:hypothetical protein
MPPRSEESEHTINFFIREGASESSGAKQEGLDAPVKRYMFKHAH